jgi:hypothetical protein
MRGIIIAFFFFVIVYVIMYHSKGILETFVHRMPTSKGLYAPYDGFNIDNHKLSKSDILLDDILPKKDLKYGNYTPHKPSKFSSYEQITNNTFPENIDSTCGSIDLCNALYGEYHFSPDKAEAPNDKYVRVGFFNTDTLLHN